MRDGNFEGYAWGVIGKALNWLPHLNGLRSVIHWVPERPFTQRFRRGEDQSHLSVVMAFCCFITGKSEPSHTWHLWFLQEVQGTARSVTYIQSSRKICFQFTVSLMGQILSWAIVQLSLMSSHAMFSDWSRLFFFKVRQWCVPLTLPQVTANYGVQCFQVLD